MLDDDEFARALSTIQDGASKPLQLLDEYNRLTGFRETNPNAVWHHRISLYGPPCGSCGKPLRTPVATFCAACGAPRVRPDQPVA